MLLAAGMAGQAAALLARAGFVPTFGDELWDTSSILADNGLIGRSLHAMVGYSDRPSGIQLIAYLTVLLALASLGYLFGSRPGRTSDRGSPQPQGGR